MATSWGLRELREVRAEEGRAEEGEVELPLWLLLTDSPLLLYLRRL